MGEGRIAWLSLLLAAKVGLTAFLVAGPFILLPKPRLEKSLGITTSSPTIFRLYGVAVTALLVGYAFGIPAAEAGRFPWGVVWMGTVSNGGAAVLLLANSRGSNRGRMLGAFFALIAVGLIAAMIAPAEALQKAWYGYRTAYRQAAHQNFHKFGDIGGKHVLS